MKKWYYSKSLIILILLVMFFSVTNCSLSQVHNDEIELVESVPVETSLDIKDIRNTLEVWQEMISKAKNSLNIETFYVSTQKGEPLEVIINEIKQAAGRGVKVRIISKEKFRDIYPEPLAILSQFDNIEVRFIDFSKIADGIMRAKYFIVDDNQVFLGSQNLDWRALDHIHELWIRIKNKYLSKLLLTLFNTDWEIVKNNIVPTEISNNSKYEIPLCIHLTDREVPVIPGFSPRNLLPYQNLWDEPRIVELIDTAKKEVNIQLLTY